VVSYRSHRKPAQRGRGWPARVAVVTALAGAAAALSPTVPAGARPGDGPGSASGSGSSAGARVDRLYAQAESATEKYNGAAERAGELRRQVEYAQQRAARGQAKVNRLRSALASFAGAQYRSGGLDPSVALMLSEDPDGYLDKSATLDRIGSRQEDKLGQLMSAQRELKQQRSEAGVKLSELERQRAELKRQKKAVEKRLAAARRLLGSLSPEEKAERAARERASRAEGSGGRFGAGQGGSSSARAAAAVAAARSAIGRPYVWGAAGPGSFDCSGLTQWAYGRAGTAIPRTSQGQRSAGRQVPLSQAQPGDLVVYRDDASHVAMYVGDGKVVHAAHPGEPVRYDPGGMMPLSAVTRP
jgi:peptidoglycan DL-endopeptidase CwlO